MRAKSAEEYARFTEQLAQELLETYTPESLAVVTAQHIIYVDELKCVLEENKTEPDYIVEIAKKIATEVAMTVLEARRKHLAEKRADAVRNRKKDVMALARSIATEKWREDPHQKIKIGKMAEIVYGDLQEAEDRKLASGPDVVRRWIRPVAPDYAKKPGAQR